MNLKKHGLTFIVVILFIVSLFLITVTASTIINTNTSVSSEDINQYVEDTINEITRYIQIKQIYGAFTTHKPYSLSKIAIMISPLYSNDIDISNLMIQIQTHDSLSIYTYSDQVIALENNDVFTHPIWNQLTNRSFGIISMIDKDKSLIHHHVLSDASDLGVLTIPIEDGIIQKGDDVTICILSGDSIQKTISFKTPLPINKIVDLW